MKTIGLWGILAGAVMLAGCSTAPEGELTGSVGKLYNDGMNEMQTHHYAQAIHRFEELDRQYPYSVWASRGQIMTAYAQLLKGDYAESIVTIDRFVKMHPGHENLAYLYYLKGLNHYYQMTDVNRDQSETQNALDAFQEVVTRFPMSTYAADAKLKMTLCQDHLAGKEMAVGRFYLQQKQYLAAVNRFRHVVQSYQTTTQTPEALYRLVEAYIALGVLDEAQRAGAILGYNYPASSWYAKGYALLTKSHLVPEGGQTTWAKKLGKGFKDLF